MKNSILLIATILGLIATSCKKENVEPQGELQQMPITITASYKTNDGTKVDYTENGNTITATWQSGDEILVAYDGYVSTLTLVSGAGTGSATFSGEITYTHTPTATSILSCYVKDQNNEAALTVENNNIIYSDAAFLAQDGTLAGAGKCNTYMSMATYGDGTSIKCSFGVNTSMLKFNVVSIEDNAGQTATLSYKSGDTEISKATFTVSSTENTVYLAIPAGQYSGEQILVYTCGSTEWPFQLSATQANFAAGQTYSKEIDYINFIPFTFEAKDGAATVTFVKGSYGGSSVTLSYSTDGVNWSEYTPSTPIPLTNQGDKVSFKAMTTNSVFNPGMPDTYFTCSGACYIYGNIMSLLQSTGYETATTLTSNYAFRNLFYGLNPSSSYQNIANPDIYSHPTKQLLLPATTLTRNCYEAMFANCSNLTKAPKLPATTLADYCYRNMFLGCTNLTEAPELLPAMTLTQECYAYMFEGCTNLSVAPELPATTLADGCYFSMFRGTNLTTAPNLPARTMKNECYRDMFRDCTNLSVAPELPATTLENYCYQYMFSGCNALVVAPELPASNMAQYCYEYMFHNCRNLVVAPELSSTNLANYCYDGMFYGCTSLTKAPDLPATTLKNYCYRRMFYGCSNLNSIKCLATSGINSSNSTTDWVNGVAASGTFTKASDVTSWPTGNNGIPTNWTVNDQ